MDDGDFRPGLYFPSRSWLSLDGIPVGASKKLRSAILFFLAFVFAVGPYFAQSYLPGGTGLIIISLISAVLALICTFTALQQARKVATELTYLPFGPALAIGCGLMVFYNAPILQFVANWFHH